jgi:hypothetical protein
MLLVIQGWINALVFAGLGLVVLHAGGSSLPVAALLVIGGLFVGSGVTAAKGNRWPLATLWSTLLIGLMGLIGSAGGFPGMLEGGIPLAGLMAYLAAGLFGALWLPARNLLRGPAPPLSRG